MRTFIILFSLTIFSMSSNSILSQNTNVTISHDGYLKVDEVFKLLSSQTTYRFIYHENLFQDLPKVPVKKGVIKANDLLKLSLNERQFNFDLTPDNTIVITKNTLPVGLAINQQLIKGKVTDAFGSPLFGATVLLKGTTQATSTDLEGDYEISYSNQDQVLVFSMIGYETKEVVVGKQTTLNISLKESVNKLDEVVLVSDGYSKVGIEQSTGAVTKIKGADLEKRGYSNLINSLEGMTAGLSITPDPTSEGNLKLSIRGVSTLNGDSAPLVVIDGFITETDISQINPYDIASITLLKDAGSTSIYGARASNGVIVITTKKGIQGKTKFSYTTNVTFSHRPDVEYRLNRLTGSDLVDAQIKGMYRDTTYSHSLQWYLDNNPSSARYYKEALNPVYRTKLMEWEGYYTQAEANAIIDPLRSIDNTSQIQKLFTQNPYEEQHNLSMSGGSDKSVYRASLNYAKNKSSYVGDKTQRVIFDIQNSITFSEKAKLDLTGNFRINDGESIPYDREIVFNHISPYELLVDNSGNALPTTVGSVGYFGGKDPIEIQRLIDLGLYDETYYPVNELNNYTQSTNGFDVRVQAMLYLDLAKGLKGTFGGKYEKGASKLEKLSKNTSYEVSSLINNFSPIDYSGDDTELNIPRGGRLVESRFDSYSYTLRSQLDFDKSIQKHKIRLIAGTEIKSTNTTSVTTDKFGYDEKTLQFKHVDKRRLSTTNVNNLNYPYGSIRGYQFNDGSTDVTNRYFSIYGNFGYDFDRKYVLSGSARIDQSNLFGTDPEYRYKPFWSVGGKWNVDREDFFNSAIFNKLAVRTSYGINGNIANDYGPFNIAQNMVSYYDVDTKLVITSPAVSDLRWERTATLNFGTDMTMLNRKVRLGLDYYIKTTDDALATSRNNPTNGFSTIMKNSARLVNRGFEVSLNTVNLQKENFRWASTFMLRFNSNKVISVIKEEVPFLDDVPRSLQNVEGKPVNSFYVFNFARLDSLGQAVYIKADGEEFSAGNGVGSINRHFVIEDLVHAGTVDPKIGGSFSNNLKYKNFDLSFMFVFNYGHKMLKDSYDGGRIFGTPNNIPADAGKAWEKPGDELTTNIPEFLSNHLEDQTLDKYSTKNIIDAGYTRLREVALSYSIPKKAVNFLSIDNATVNFRANNLFLIANNNAGIDPEAHGFGTRYFRITPSYSFGININF